MKIIDRAKTHFESLGTQSITIPEWSDENGNPTTIYWNPINLAEKKKIFRSQDSLTDAGILVDIIIMKALDKDGNKLFSLEDKLVLMHKVDSDIISRIANQMVLVITPEESKKK